MKLSVKQKVEEAVLYVPLTKELIVVPAHVSKSLDVGEEAVMLLTLDIKGKRKDKIEIFDCIYLGEL